MLACLWGYIASPTPVYIPETCDDPVYLGVAFNLPSGSPSGQQGFSYFSLEGKGLCLSLITQLSPEFSSPLKLLLCHLTSFSL